MAAAPLPEPKSDDPEDVTTALETAQIFGMKGDTNEALRWLRRAAAAAGEAGLDMRQLELARAAAELSESGPEAEPPTPLAPAVQPQAAAEPEAPPPQANAAPEAPPPGAGATPQPGGPRRKPPPLPQRAPRPAAPGTRPSAPDSPSIAPRPSAAAPAGAAPRAAAEVPLRGHRDAQRVSVRRGGETGSYSVQVLDDGAPAPEGAEEALLVFLRTKG